MESRPGRGEPFDEQAVLAELERVREQIQAYRAQRRAVQDEFGRFVKSFKEPQPIVTPDPPRSTAPAAASPAPVLPASSTPVIPASPAPVMPAVPAPVIPPTPAPTTASPAAAPAPPPPVHAPAAPASPVQVQAPAAPVAAPVSLDEQAPIAQFEPVPDAPPKTSNQTTMLAAAAAVVLLALGAWMFWPSSGDTPAGTEAAPPTAAPAASATPPPAEPVPAAAPTRGTELVTTSAVWLRVLVDGARVMEREVPAGTTIPLTPRESLVVRAGNGAAVRLTLAGEDQGVLGREGFPITRTFTIPAERR